MSKSIQYVSYNHNIKHLTVSAGRKVQTKRFGKVPKNSKWCKKMNWINVFYSLSCFFMLFIKKKKIKKKVQL